MARLGTDAASLVQRNPRAIGLQITADTRRAACGPRHHDKGWDPSIQGTTGIMMRFGGPELADLPRHRLRGGLLLRLSLPLIPDLLALYARERRGDGVGDWAETSLCKRGDADPVAVPASAPNRRRVRAVQIADRDDEKRARASISSATADLRAGHRTTSRPIWASAPAQRHSPGAPSRTFPGGAVQTCKELADRHRDHPTTTVSRKARGVSAGATSACAKLGLRTCQASPGRVHPVAG